MTAASDLPGAAAVPRGGWLYYAESTNGIGHLVRARLFGELAARLGCGEGRVRTLVSPWSELEALDEGALAWRKLPYNEIDTDSQPLLEAANRHEWILLAQSGSWEGLVVDGLPRWDLADDLPAGLFPQVVVIGRGRALEGAAECLARSEVSASRLVAVIHEEGSREAAIWKHAAGVAGWDCRSVGPLFQHAGNTAQVSPERGSRPRLLITTGGGGPNPTLFRREGKDDTAEFVLGSVRACASMREHVPVEIWVQLGPNFRNPALVRGWARDARSVPPLRVVNFIPGLHDRWSDFDQVIGLCGYNTFHELMSARVPALLFYRPYSSEVFADRIGRASGSSFLTLAPLVPDREQVMESVRSWLQSNPVAAR